MRLTLRMALSGYLVCLCVGATSIMAQTEEDAARASGVADGLVVHLGSMDGSLEVALARSGRMLVHGLSLSESDLAAARAAIAREGLRGLASVDLVSQMGRLPYANDLANLIVADLDTLGNKAPSEKEMLRVLVPGGAACVRRDRQWRTIRNPWPEGLDDWTHWCYGPEGNAVSHDTMVRPSTSLKWIAGVQGQDLRISRGMLVSPLRPTRERGLPDTVDLVGRDAFNGVPAWRGPTGLVTGDRPHQLVAAGGLVFHFPMRQSCFAVATDTRTGRVVREFSEGLRRPLPEQGGKAGGRPGIAVLLACGPTLLQGYGREVAALDIATGALRWRAELTCELGAMVATPDGRRVFVHEVQDWDRGWARWGKHKTAAVTCLLDGRPAWRNTQLADEEISDLIHDGGSLYAFDPTTNLGDDGDADLFKFAADTGALVWSKKGPKHNYNVFLNNAVVRGADIVSWGPFNNLRSYSVADGNERNHTINGYNQRCTRMSATRDWLVFGLTTWVDRDFNWTQMAVGRSDCAYPAFLAHGHTYFTYNLACSCINPLRGIVALAPEDGGAPLDDASRLESLSGRRPVAPQPETATSRPSSVIAAEWQPDSLLFYLLDELTPPVRTGEMTLIADIHRHTLTAKRDDRAAWSFTAGGRIYGPPLIHDGRCYVGSADGWLYCLDTATGSPLWRFLAAPRQRMIVAYAQAESAWPVYNVVLHDGAVCVAAGRHAELDGGLYIWGLDPVGGKIRWRTTLHTPPARYAAGSKAVRGDRALSREVVSVTPLNGGLEAKDGQLTLVSPILKKSGSSNSKWGYFENPPDQGRGELQARRIQINTVEWNGKTINPQELAPMEIRKR